MKRSLLALIGLGVLAATPVVAQQPAEEKPAQPQEDVVKREEVVVVTASKVESTLINAPATMSVVTNETINNSAAQNYGDLLRSVPGVNVIQTSARDINLASRQATGTLENTQLALLDGRSIYLDFFGMVLWDFVPNNAAEIKQIEVVRGPASAVWGANALSGVVNIITKSPREAAGNNLAFTGGMFSRDAGSQAGEGSGKSFGVSGSIARAPNDHWSYKIAAGYFNSDAFSRPVGQIPVIADPRVAGAQCSVSTLPNGIQVGTGRDCVGGGFYPLDGQPSSPGQFGTTFQNSGTSQPKVDIRVDQDMSNGARITYGVGFAGTEGIVHTGIGPFDIQSGSYMSYGKINFSKGALKINLFANLVDAEAPNLLLPDPLTGAPLQLNFKTQTYDIELGHSKVIAGKHILSYGGNARRNNFDITITPNSEDRNEFGAYFQDEIFFDRFRFAIGGRVDKFGNIDDPVFSPRVSAMFKPAQAHSFRISYNKAFRSPSTINNFLEANIVQPIDLRALAAFGVPGALVAAPFPLVVRAVGSDIPIEGHVRPAMREESLTAYEVSYTGTFADKTTIGLAFYINDRDDNINFSPLPNDFDPYTAANPPPGWDQRFAPLGLQTARGILAVLASRGIVFPRTAFTYLNLGPLRNRGMEVSIDHRFSNSVTAFANYSWQDDPEVKDSANPFPTGELGLPPTNRFNAGLNYNDDRFLGTVGVNYTDGAFWSDVLNAPYHGFTDSFTMVNASFGVKWSNGKITTSVKATNLFNEDIQQHIFGDILKRSIVGELRLKF
jgi:outer membrane receptor protein involved in Fe transport